VSKLVIAAMLFFSLSTIAVVQADSVESPIQQFLELYSIEEIQYNLRLDDVTLAYNDLFQKAASYESEGFIAYHGDSLDYRIYQDAIRLTLQEVIGIQIPQDFHFLDIPCFGDEILGELEDIMHFFGPDKNEGYKVQPSMVRSYESAIQDLIKNTPSDANRVASYKDDLARAWEDKE
jgi:hypothetical protein